MSRPPAKFSTRMPVTLRRRLDALARRSGCSRNALLNDLVRRAVERGTAPSPRRVMRQGQRKRADCRFR